ncbi:MAG: hypothetical protein ACOVP7_09870 [Lacibacter sp.]
MQNPSVVEQPVYKQSTAEFLLFLLFTVAAVVNGQTSVFYVLYFFWWSELLRIIIDRICYKRNANAVYNPVGPLPVWTSLFILGIHFVFIVVLFGFIANWDNVDLLTLNMRVLLFKNFFFNGNLLFVVLQRLYMHWQQQPVKIEYGGFTPNILILHIAIIFGGILQMFVVKRYTDIFTPDNLWGSALLLLPFLLLKAGFYWFKRPKVAE